MIRLLPLHFAKSSFATDQFLLGLPFEHAHGDVQMTAARLPITLRNMIIEIRESLLQVFGDGRVMQVTIGDEPMRLLVQVSRKEKIAVIEKVHIQC